jgi:hypothetical protein
VITAAAADRPSFGCEDGATWTYFGEAFFNSGAGDRVGFPISIQEGTRARDAREKREGFEPSNPQMAGGSEVLSLLTRR